MKKKPLVLLFTLAFLGSSLSTPAFAAVKAGATCKTKGQVKTVSNLKYTCIKSGKKLLWNKGVAVKKPTSIKNISYSSPSVTSDNVEVCKIKEVSMSRGFTGAGFPAWNTLTPSTGTVKWALIPIDFSDLPGEKNFRSRVDEQMQLLSEWFDTVSEGQFKVEWVVADKWVRLPSPSADYKIDRSENLDRMPNGLKLWNDAMTSSDPTFDFTNIQTVNFILPKGQNIIQETSQGFPWDAAVKNLVTKEGSVSSFSIPGKFMDQMGRQYWSYWAHEFGHAIGLPHIGSSRAAHIFQGWDLLGGQDGPTRELSGWLRFLARWLPDEKVFCKQISSLGNVELTLVPLSSGDSGLKVAIVPLSESKALIIESRRVTKFSCRTPTPRNGVLVYTYDAKIGHGEDFLTPFSPPGRAFEQTIGCITNSTIDYLLRENDKITVEGVTVEVLLHRNYDRIKISR
jgi:M6 family metalloprotease-like protein